MKPIVIAALVLLGVETADADTRLGQLPMHFETGRREANGAATFLARGERYAVMLTPRQAILVLTRGGARSTLRMSLAGAKRDPLIAGENELPGKVNYLIGNDPSKWRANVPTYARVKYTAVYPGIDLVYYGTEADLEFDFVVAPRANPRAIRLRFDGADAVAIDADGALLLKTVNGDVRLRRPVSYQQTNGGRQEIASRYVRHRNGQISVAVGAYDRSRPLIIDPVLAYATYFGGSKSDGAGAIAVDAAGNVYFAGQTSSDALIATAGAFQTARASAQSDADPWYQEDAFITKLNAAGTAIIYSTYLGGGHSDAVSAIAIDAAGSAYVTGATRSANFPTVNAPQPVYGGTSYLATFGDAFVAKLSPDGSALVYSTYAGGAGPDGGNGIAVDAAGRAHVAGSTQSMNFPMVNAMASCLIGPGGFVLQMNPAGTAFDYSTCFPSHSGSAITTSADGFAYVAGSRNNYIGWDPGPILYPDAAYLAVFTPTGSLLFSNDIPKVDRIHGVAIDVAGFIYLTGATTHADFPVVNAAQPVYGGSGVICCSTGDAFVAKLNPSGSAFVYATFLGGSRDEEAYAIAVDSTGAAWVVGFTESWDDFPTVDPLESTGRTFVTQLTPTGSAFRFSTYLGNGVSASDVAVDAAGNAYVAGLTTAEDFATANPLQRSLRGSSDAFVAKITEAPLPAILALDPAVVTQGATVPTTISGLNFVSGATSVTAVGAGVSASGTYVSGATSLMTNVTIAADAPLGAVDLTATTPLGTSNRRQLAIYSSQPGCRVSLPVAVDGTPLDPFAHFGIGALEPTEGTWMLLLIIYDASGSVTMYGQGLFQGPIPADQPPTMIGRNLWVDPPVLAVVNAFFNPALCAFNVALTPTVDPAAESSLRALLASLVGQLTLP